MFLTTIPRRCTSRASHPVSMRVCALLNDPQSHSAQSGGSGENVLCSLPRRCNCEPFPAYLHSVGWYVAAVYVPLVRLPVPLRLCQHLINTLKPQQWTCTAQQSTAEQAGHHRWLLFLIVQVPHLHSSPPQAIAAATEHSTAQRS